MAEIDYTDPNALQTLIAPPKDDNDRTTRVEGWKNFLTQVTTQLQGSPNVGQMLQAWGAQMAQPVRPGDTGAGRASRAMSAVSNVQAQDSARAQELLRLGMDIRQLDQVDDRLDVQERGQDIQAASTAATIGANAERGELDRESRAEENRLNRESREGIAALERAQRAQLKRTLSADAAASLESAKLKAQSSTYAANLKAAQELALDENGVFSLDRMSEVMNYLETGRKTSEIDKLVQIIESGEGTLDQLVQSMKTSGASPEAIQLTVQRVQERTGGTPSPTEQTTAQVESPKMFEEHPANVASEVQPETPGDSQGPVFDLSKRARNLLGKKKLQALAPGSDATNIEPHEVEMLLTEIQAALAELPEGHRYRAGLASYMKALVELLDE